MKPEWKDAPEWAEWLVRDELGGWWWFERPPKVVSFDGGPLGWACSVVGTRGCAAVQSSRPCKKMKVEHRP